MWIKNSDYGMLTFTFIISHLGDTLCMEAQIRNHWTTITPNSVQTNAVNAQHKLYLPTVFFGRRFTS